MYQSSRPGIVYKLINQEDYDSCKLVSDDFHVVAHELLSIINSNLQFLRKMSMTINLINMDLSGLYIIECKSCIEQFKRFDMVVDVIRFNIMDLHFHNSRSVVELPNIYLFNHLIDSIKNCSLNQVKTPQMAVPQQIPVPQAAIPCTKQPLPNRKGLRPKYNPKKSKNDACPLPVYTKKPPIHGNPPLDLLTESDNMSEPCTDSDTDTESDIETITNVVDVKNVENIENPDELKKKIDELLNMKKQIETEIKNEEKTIKKTEEKFAELAADISDQKREIQRIHSRESQRQQIYQQDRKLYDRFKFEISQGLPESSIPEHFILKYPVFKYLDQNNLLDKNHDYETFVLLFEKYNPLITNSGGFKKSYVPHDIFYLKDDERYLFKQISKEKEGVVADFVNNICKKKFKSSDEILAELSDSDAEIEICPKNTESKTDSKSENTSSDSKTDPTVVDATFDFAQDTKV